MSNSNYRTQTTAAQLPVWMVATTWDVESELTEAKRDSDGRWLKRNIDLNVKPVAKFADALAARSDYDDSDMLFAAKR